MFQAILCLPGYDSGKPEFPKGKVIFQPDRLGVQKKGQSYDQVLWLLVYPSHEISWRKTLGQSEWRSPNWLVVWSINFIFPLILGCCPHPNWRTHMFQRGGPVAQPPTSQRFSKPPDCFGDSPACHVWWPEIPQAAASLSSAAAGRRSEEGSYVKYPEGPWTVDR